MQGIWWTVATLALVAVCISGQNLGTNYGINLRLTQRGLSYAAQKAVDDLYDTYRHEPIRNFHGGNDGSSYSLWNLKIPSLSRPTFNLHINQGQGLSPVMNLGYIEVTGNFNFSYNIWWFFNITTSGTFVATASQISMQTSLGVGTDASGKPTVTLQSCSSNIGAFTVDIEADGMIGNMLNYFEDQVGDYLKSMLAPIVCEELEELVREKLDPELREMKTTAELMDGRLLLDYSLLRGPHFDHNHFDTTVKGDVSWKGRTTGTPTRERTWPPVPGSSAKMATIYLTDYIMNAVGVLLHNDGMLSYNVTREEVSSNMRSQLSLSCPNSFCVGALFPKLASQYPDGWLEAGLRTNSPPRLTMRNNHLTGNFSGTIEVYVNRPNGVRTRTATADASMSIPLTLRIHDDVLKASVRTPRISVTPGQSETNEIQNFLRFVASGFAQQKLNDIGHAGMKLPTFANVTFIDPIVHIRQGIIAVSTDVDYHAPSLWKLKKKD